MTRRAASAEGRVDVVFIAGAGRSGSTLLARLLGEVDGFVNLGEAARYLYHARLQRNEFPCGCGRAPASCEFWSSYWASVPPELRTFGARFIRSRNLPRLLWPGVLTPREVGEIEDSLREILTEIRERGRHTYLVDASKHPATGMVLASIPSIRLHTVHLVRDPRGVVSSWSSRKGYLKSQPMISVLWFWISANLGSELLARRSATYRLVRYEDLAHAPRATIHGLLETWGARDRDVEFLDRDPIPTGIQHSLAGNPEKLSQRSVSIAYRDWSLAGWRRILTSLVTFPMRARYGYVREPG